jgi:tRNA dimethylallyltransferase
VRTIIICGATATGKSDLAVGLAQEIGAEIVNADSMQVYVGMDIGTAKLDETDRGGITHHLLDVLKVNEDSTVAWYQKHARATIDDIHKRGLDAIIVGGTGLYIKAIVDDLNFPDTDPVVRSRLELESIEHGSSVLFERLEKLDPVQLLQSIEQTPAELFVLSKLSKLQVSHLLLICRAKRVHVIRLHFTLV